MIVRCQKCKTKYSFDESILEGHGGWVRCSRCGEVFFLDHFSTDDISIGPDALSSADMSQAEMQTTGRDDFKQDLQSAAGIYADGGERSIIADPEVSRKYLTEETGRDRDSKGGQLNLSGFDSRVSDDDGGQQIKDKIIKDRGTKVKEEPARPRTKQWIFFILILLSGVVYLWFFFEIGNQVANVASSAMSALTEKIQGTNTKGEDGGLVQVQLTDLRQRFITNIQLGNLRVVEGIAVNQSSHPMTRIKIRGELVGADGILLGEMTSYCGNIITDEELSGMTEEQILKELSNPLGSDISNDQVAAKGQIPFLLVFTHEPPGVMKTFVVPAQAERLLP